MLSYASFRFRPRECTSRADASCTTVVLYAVQEVYRFTVISQAKTRDIVPVKGREISKTEKNPESLHHSTVL